MAENSGTVEGKGVYVLLAALLNGIIVKQAFVYNTAWYWLLLISLPALIILLLHQKETKD